MGSRGQRAGRRRFRTLRARLTLAFASVIALVLAACGVLVYVQFARSVDARTDQELRERAGAFASLADGELAPSRIIAISGERFAQVYEPGGRLAATSRVVARERMLSAAQLGAARRAPLFADRATAATDDGLRVRAFVIDDGRIAVLGESLDAREKALRQLALLLGLALPGALLLASFTGYQVAGAALRPVEAMRRRAAQIGEGDLSERLEQPGTDDELDRLASTLNALLGRLEGAFDRERQIVGDASHELRTPISVLRTRLDVALRGEDDPARLRAALEEARADAVRLSRLADDLLVLARADQGRLPLRSEPIDAQDLLERTAARHRPAADAAGRALTAKVQTDGGLVLLADPDRADQILDNLVVNALRYGAGTVALTAAAASGMAELSVADAGPGFPPELADRAFDRFSQGDAARSHGGSGLGLALVAAIAKAHGGDASAGRGADGGARVRVRLPLA